MIVLPIDPFSGQSGPYSTEYIQTASNIKQTGSVVPYSLEHLQSVGIDPNVVAKKEGE